MYRISRPRPDAGRPRALPEGVFILVEAAVHLRALAHTAAFLSTHPGNRPSFTEAAPPEQAEPLYEAFCAALRDLGIQVETGIFGARMAVEFVNDGPVTIVLEA
jgi:D-tyrosyl-tRNA(Tyr) deacylase